MYQCRYYGRYKSVKQDIIAATNQFHLDNLFVGCFIVILRRFHHRLGHTTAVTLPTYTIMGMFVDISYTRTCIRQLSYLKQNRMRPVVDMMLWPKTYTLCGGLGPKARPYDWQTGKFTNWAIWLGHASYKNERTMRIAPTLSVYVLFYWHLLLINLNWLKNITYKCPLRLCYFYGIFSWRL